MRYAARGVITIFGRRLIKNPRQPLQPHAWIQAVSMSCSRKQVRTGALDFEPDINLLSGLFNSPPQRWSLTDEGLVVTIDPYEVLAYADGTTEVNTMERFTAISCINCTDSQFESYFPPRRLTQKKKMRRSLCRPTKILKNIPICRLFVASHIVFLSLDPAQLGHAVMVHQASG